MKTFQKTNASYTFKEGKIEIIQFSGKKIVGKVTLEISELLEVLKKGTK